MLFPCFVTTGFSTTKLAWLSLFLLITAFEKVIFLFFDDLMMKSA